MKFIKKTDIIIIGIVIIVAVLWSAGYKVALKNKPTKAEIYYNSVLIKTIDLDTKEDKHFSLPENDHVIFHLTSDGTIGFEESDCPDKICIRSGQLSLIGESATCLPNKIVLKIVPKGKYDKEDLDIIVGTKVN